MRTWRSYVRRVVYGPLMIPQQDPGQSGMWLAPVRLDLDDLVALKKQLGEHAGSQDRSFLATYQPGDKPEGTPALLGMTLYTPVDPSEIPGLTREPRQSLTLIAFPDEQDKNNTLTLSLSDDHPSSVHGGVVPDQSLNVIAAGIADYLERRNVPRRMPYRRFRLAVWGAVALAFTGLATWGVVSAWALSAPMAVLMGALSVLALYTILGHAVRTNVPYVLTERDTVSIEMISRAEVDRKRHDNVRWRITVGVAIAAVLIAIAVPFINNALR